MTDKLRYYMPVIIALVILVPLVIWAFFFTVSYQKHWDHAPCQEFKSGFVGDVPVRCAGILEVES